MEKEQSILVRYRAVVCGRMERKMGSSVLYSKMAWLKKSGVME